MRNDAVN